MDSHEVSRMSPRAVIPASHMRKKVERNLQLVHPIRVRMLRSLLAVILVLSWVPITSHCQLESVPGLEFLECSTEGHASDTESHPCQDGDCCTVESSDFASSRNYQFTRVMVVAILPFDSSFGVEQLPPTNIGLGVLTGSPPELPASWQFLSRAALPARAPSRAS
jgi:hypothetical protein